MSSGGNRRQRGVRGQRLGRTTTLQEYLVGSHDGRPAGSRGYYRREPGGTDCRWKTGERAAAGVGGFGHLGDRFLAVGRRGHERRGAVSVPESLLFGGFSVGISIAWLTLGPSIEGDVV